MTQDMKASIIGMYTYPYIKPSIHTNPIIFILQHVLKKDRTA